MLWGAWNKIKQAINEATRSDYDETARKNAIQKYVSARIDGIADELKRYNDTYDRENPKKTARENLTVYALIAAAVFTFVLAILSACQLHEMIKVYGPINEQANNAGKSLIEANRAWIVPHLLRLPQQPLKAGADATLILTYGNSGREPAKNVGHEPDSKNIGVEGLAGATLETGIFRLRDLIEKAGFEDTCATADKKRLMGVVYPGPLDGSFASIVVAGNKITQAAIEGQAFIVIKGCFMYETMTEPHKSKYCLFYNKVLDDMKPLEYRNFFSNCPTGNDAD